MFCIFFIFLIQFAQTYNKESGCGCGLSRGLADNVDTHNVFGVFHNKDEEQCPLGFETNYVNDEGLNFKDEMVLIPSGSYQFGTDNVFIESDKEGPERVLKLKSFYLDKYEVSNRDFNSFVKLTNYKTEAEIFGDSFVFTLFLNNTFKEQLQEYRVVQALWWYKVIGADWRHPFGPDSNITDVMDHPVIHVSWNDAKAFCAWRGARLPTEAEWEAACRGGQRDTLYPWGNKLFPDHKHMANIWQGTFPNHNSAKDGFVGTSPVTMFPANDFGLYNMAGNVWEWTEDSWADNSLISGSMIARYSEPIGAISTDERIAVMVSPCHKIRFKLNLHRAILSRRKYVPNLVARPSSVEMAALQYHKAGSIQVRAQMFVSNIAVFDFSRVYGKDDNILCKDLSDKMLSHVRPGMLARQFVDCIIQGATERCGSI